MNQNQRSVSLRNGRQRTGFLLGGAILALVASAAGAQVSEVSKSSINESACNWLQEVKRTNTWLERDQNSRKAAHMLHERKRTGESVTDQQLAAAEDTVAVEARVLQSELDDLVARCGWPTTSGYGDKAPQYAAFIVQHADLPYQEKYLPMMQAAADSKELAPRHVAMLVDRVLMRKNLPQRYGSQLTMKDGKLVVYPIEDPDRVNDRRSQVGMVPASFCAYIASFTPTPQSDLCEFSKPKNAESQ